MYVWRFRFFSLLGLFALLGHKSAVVERGLFRTVSSGLNWNGWEAHYASMEPCVVRSEVGRRMSLAAFTPAEFIHTAALLRYDTFARRAHHLFLWLSCTRKLEPEELAAISFLTRDGWDNGQVEDRRLATQIWADCLMETARKARALPVSREALQALRNGMARLDQEDGDHLRIWQSYKFGRELQDLYEAINPEVRGVGAVTA